MPELQAQVSALVRDLDAVEKSRRDAAERNLIALGTAVLEFLPEPDPRMSAEVRLRVGRARSQLERTLAESAGKASSVSLDADNMPLADILAAVETQTGNKIVDFRPQFGEVVHDTRLKLEFNKTPFWPAMDEILDSADLSLYNFAGENSLALVNKPANHLPRLDHANYVGAFRIAGTSVSAERNLRDSGQRVLQVSLEVAWEPRVTPIIVTLLGDQLKAVDDTGQPLKSEAGGRQVEINVPPGSTAVDLPLQFDLPPRQAQRIAKLSGTLAVVVPGRVESFRFDNLSEAKKSEQRRAGVAVTLEQVRKNQALWEVRVRVSFADAGQALESHRNWIFNNEAWLESPTGEKIAYGGMETTLQTEREVGVAYIFNADEKLDGYTFVYRTPVAILNTPVAFELNHLELP
jgi:hypothetical protein